MVGMVVTISPNFSLYRMVVLPAASNPTRRDIIELNVDKKQRNTFTSLKSTHKTKYKSQVKLLHF